MITPNISIRNASISYKQNVIFSNLNLHLPAGQWTGLIGPSGVGKSSLLKFIAGLQLTNTESKGCVTIDNNVPMKKQIAYMAQTDLLLPWLTVFENVTLSLKLRRHTRSSYTAKQKKAKLLLDDIGLDHAMNLYPHQLSGGMRQRTALARTLLEEKPITLMDEPFSALDALTRYKLQDLAATFLKGKTVFFITHDPLEALRLSDHIYIMKGEPASITHIASLPPGLPRPLNHPAIPFFQQKLFKELLNEDPS